MADTKKTKSFEEAMQRLEEIVRQMETGDVPLEKSLQLFEEGVKLSRLCHERLNEAEKKITLLMEDKNTGKLVETELRTDTKDNLFNEDENVPF